MWWSLLALAPLAGSLAPATPPSRRISRRDGLARPRRHGPRAAAAVDFDGLPVIWAPPVASPSRRTLRSRFTEFCVRGWVREQRARKRLEFASSDIESAAPARCDFAGASNEGDKEEVGSACSEVITWTGSEMKWWGYERGDEPKLQLQRLEAQLTNLHRRVLTRGRRGSVRATLRLGGADVDGSLWIRNFLTRIVKRILSEVEGYADARVAFRTSVASDPTGAPRVRLDGTTADGVGFVCSFLLAAEHGALVLRAPEVFLQGRPTFKLRRAGSIAVPAAVLEDLGRLYLSTVAVDASAQSGAAFAVMEVRLADADSVEVEVVSSAASRAAMRRIARQHVAGGPSASSKQTKLPEWRLHLGQMFRGAAHPVRHTFVVGERLPWLLNPRSAAPVAVVWVFQTLSWAFAVAAVPDRVYRGLSTIAKRIRFARRGAGRRGRGDGLPVVRQFQSRTV